MGDKTGEKLREKLSIIPDYRHSCYVGHKLSDILIIVMMALLCELDQLKDIPFFKQVHHNFSTGCYSKYIFGLIYCQP